MQEIDPSGGDVVGSVMRTATIRVDPNLPIPLWERDPEPSVAEPLQPVPPWRRETCSDEAQTDVTSEVLDDVRASQTRHAEVTESLARVWRMGGLEGGGVADVIVSCGSGTAQPDDQHEQRQAGMHEEPASAHARAKTMDRTVGRDNLSKCSWISQSQGYLPPDEFQPARDSDSCKREVASELPQLGRLLDDVPLHLS